MVHIVTTSSVSTCCNRSKVRGPVFSIQSKRGLAVSSAVIVFSSKIYHRMRHISTLIQFTQPDWAVVGSFSDDLIGALMWKPDIEYVADDGIMLAFDVQ